MTVAETKELEAWLEKTLAQLREAAVGGITMSGGSAIEVSGSTRIVLRFEVRHV